MRIAVLLCAIGMALSAMVGTGHAQAPMVYAGNDTGGIIPWSCETEAMAPAIAADFCARWDKYPRITSVHRQFGDYIAFRCLWSPHVDRFSLPAVPTRNTCLPNRLWTK